MNRAIGAVVAIACLAVVACGSVAPSGAATNRPSASPGDRRGLAGNAAFGQLVQINGTTLILSGTNGDSTVTYASTTAITQTASETVTDITAGSCITAFGSKGAGGALTATSVTLSAPRGGSCATAGLGRGGFGGGGTGSPPPNFSPRASFSPPAAAAGFTATRGRVKSVAGTSVTVTDTTGSTTTIEVPTTVKVTLSTAVTATALQTGQCLTAIGTKDSSGAVAARALTISPAGANGCAPGFGGFSGGGFPGGGGGFPGGGVPGGGASAAGA